MQVSFLFFSLPHSVMCLCANLHSALPLCEPLSRQLLCTNEAKKSLSAAINYGTWPKDYSSHIFTASHFNRSESDDFRSSIIFLREYKNKHANRHMTTRRLRKYFRCRFFICASRLFLHLSPARSEKVGTTRESNVKFVIFNKRLWGHPHSDQMCCWQPTRVFPSIFPT